ncbi:hypothetical protein J6590_067490 [Homalodisca vitripennis]|nr:hypothetical protein J6590_067490 [Homalodisca vitripennis]
MGRVIPHLRDLKLEGISRPTQGKIDDTSTSPAECWEHYTTLEHGLSPQTGILLLPLLQLERLETCRHSNNPTSRTVRRKIYLM